MLSCDYDIGKGRGEGQNVSVKSAWSIRPAYISGFCSAKQFGCISTPPWMGCLFIARLKNHRAFIKSFASQQTFHAVCEQSLSLT